MPISFLYVEKTTYRWESQNASLDVIIIEVFGFSDPLFTVRFANPLNNSTAISSIFNLLCTSSSPERQLNLHIIGAYMDSNK